MTTMTDTKKTKKRTTMKKKSSPLAAIVFASLKFARMRARYQAVTRFGLASGGRQVLDECPEDLVVAAELSVEEFDSPSTRRRREIVEGHIHEFTSNPIYLELIQRVLFRGENVSLLAYELGVNDSTARSTMLRARRFLGISD